MEKLLAGFQLSRIVTGRIMIGVWLIIFYLFSFWMGLGTLSSHQFQKKIEKSKAAGKHYSIATIKALLSDQKRLEELEDMLIQGERDIRRIRFNRTITLIEQERLQTQMDDIASKVRKKFKEAGITDIPDDLSGTSIKERISEHTDIAGIYEEYLKIADNVKTTGQHIDNLNLELEQKKNESIENRTQQMAFIQKRDQILAQQEEIHEHFNELMYMERMRLVFLATMPEQMLTLILTFSMGGLGSVIYLTRIFLDAKENKSLSWYVFRTLLGIVTAFAIFILAKAGQIMISDSSVSDDISNNLNPFFISFMAVMSGLLSEQAYDRIQSSGMAFFRAGDKSKERWAFRLKQEIERQGKGISEIVGFTNASMKTVESWIDEKRPVPEREQELISIWLGKDIRDLFSDLQPASSRPQDAENVPKQGEKSIENPNKSG